MFYLTCLMFGKRPFCSLVEPVAWTLSNFWPSSKNSGHKFFGCIKANTWRKQNEVYFFQTRCLTGNPISYKRWTKNKVLASATTNYKLKLNNSNFNMPVTSPLRVNNLISNRKASIGLPIDKDRADLCLGSHQFHAIQADIKRSFHCCHNPDDTNRKLHRRSFSNTLPLNSDDRKDFTNSILNVASKIESTNIGGSSPQQSSQSQSKHTNTKLIKGSESQTSKRMKRILTHLFSEEGEPLPTLTVEKQLLGLMQMWAMEEAVYLLKESVESGLNPDRTVILNLLQQLANLGEVECLLELHEFLKDRGLSTNLKFYHCLRDAYFNSGRVEDGILMLRVIYHGSRDFDDSDLLFTLLATMTAKHFEHMLPVVESYVTDLEESDPPVTSARASLWRCLVLAEKFDKANELLEDFPEVKKMVPVQVTKLVQSQLEVDFDRDVVLTWLMNSPYVKPGLSASLFDLLILHKTTQGQWNDGLKYLSAAMSEGKKIHSKTVETFLAKFLNHLPQSQVEELSSWATALQSNSEDEDYRSDS